VIGKKLSYLIGVIHGDGSIDKSRRYVTITCESREYLEKILKPIIKDVFDYTPKTYDMDRGKYYRLIIGNKVINHFFSLFSPVGNKKGKIKIPKIVLKNKKLLISYLSGLFDTDGCLSNVEKGTKSLFFVFLQADKRFVEDVSAALKRLNISNRIYKFPSPSKPGEINRDLIEWRIYIGSKKILRDFLIKIPFHHPLKNKRREIILKIL
ncbi:MAG: hypothetical protein GW914_03360, partial [Candidatus Aenigmarchaeota archaeon]|nr:hypothetical protein [Candidatus Aenigmarchaeota archaeon]